jgi:TRAP-type C4-dicarboxylate transport system permease large subunit
MQGKITKIIMPLMLLIPIRSFSMVDSLLKAGVCAGIFVAITILAVIAYVLSKTVEKKEKKNHKKTRYIAAENLKSYNVNRIFKSTFLFLTLVLFHHQDNHQTSYNGR